MSEQFKREVRYNVIKLKTGLPVECVVVEEDWHPEYEIVWQLIKDRVEGRPNIVDVLTLESAAYRASWQNVTEELAATKQKLAEAEELAAGLALSLQNEQEDNQHWVQRVEALEAERKELEKQEPAVMEYAYSHVHSEYYWQRLGKYIPAVGDKLYISPSAARAEGIEEGKKMQFQPFANFIMHNGIATQICDDAIPNLQSDGVEVFTLFAPTHKEE